jgi:hypothetical protein
MPKKPPGKNSQIKEGDLVRWYECDPYSDIVVRHGIGLVIKVHHSERNWFTYRVHQQCTNKLLWFEENEVELYNPQY